MTCVLISLFCYSLFNEMPGAYTYIVISLKKKKHSTNMDDLIQKKQITNAEDTRVELSTPPNPEEISCFYPIDPM